MSNGMCTACDPSMSATGPKRVRERDDVGDRIDGAERIERFSAATISRACDARLELVHQQLAAIVHRRHLQRRPRRAHRAARDDIWEWCSIAVISTSSPGPRLASPTRHQVDASVALRVKRISATDRALTNSRTFSRAPHADVALAQRVHAAVDVGVVAGVMVRDGV
jgi:hypothetical protein